MNKEKQIEEMAKAIRGYARDYDDDIYGCEDHLAHYLTEVGYRKSADVAREIINDAKETLLDYHLQENKKYLNSLSKTKKQFDIETARYKAITDAVKFAINTLAELKKKYTESEKDNE